MKRMKKFLTQKNISMLALGFVASAAGVWRVYPFGTSFVAATGGNVYALVGALAGCFVGKRIPYVGMLACISAFFALRELKKQLGRPKLTHRIVISLAAAVINSFECIATVKDLWQMFLFAALFVLLTPTATYAFFVLMHRGYTKNDGIRLLCLAFGLFTVSRFFAGIILFSAPLTLVFGCAVTLAVAQSRGFLSGGAVGMICGLAAGAPSLGCLAVIGLTYGLLHYDSPFLALALAYMLGVSAYAYLASFEGIIASSVMLLFTCILFLLFKRRLPEKEAEFFEAQRDGSADLKRFAAAFSSLSGVFFAIHSKPLADAESAHALGRADETEYTPPPPEPGGLGRLSEEYMGFAAMLDSVARKGESMALHDIEGEKAVAAVLNRLSLSYRSLRLCGTRQKTLEVYGVHPNSVRISADKIRDLVGEVLGQKMTEPEFRMRDGDGIMELRTAPKLHAECAKYSRARRDEEVSGDTVSMFETSDKRFCCLISDGMGSGEDASVSSKLSALMLEKMLCLGIDTSNALRALNGALGEKRSEVFSTVDLLDADLINATAMLTKAGAAPTYFLRDGVCRTLTSATPPMGIMKDVYSESVKLSLKKGDCMILISDGALPEDGTNYIPGLLSGLEKPTAAFIVDRLSAEAEQISKGYDDLSVCAVRFY